jgi:hypothetical protein
MEEKQVFSYYESEEESHSLSKIKFRRPIEGKIEKLTVDVVVEQVRRNYRLKNKTINTKHGTPKGSFIKDKEIVHKKMENKEPFKQKQIPREETNETHKNKRHDENMKDKEENREDIMEQKKIFKIEISHAFYFTQTLSQIKISMPLLEIMKVKEYQDTAIQLISSEEKKILEIKKSLKPRIKSYDT